MISQYQYPLAVLQARQLAVDAALVVRPLLHQAAQPLALRLQAPELLAQARDALVVRVDDLLELLDLPKSKLEICDGSRRVH